MQILRYFVREKRINKSQPIHLYLERRLTLANCYAKRKKQSWELQNKQNQKLRYSNMLDNQLQLLANSWSTAAIGYNEVFVPRFEPWTNDVLRIVEEEVIQMNLDNKVNKKNDNNVDENDNLFTCCIPCCGPGQELLPVSKILGPNWYILGMDIAPGMIEIAKKRISSNNKMDAIVADCSISLPPCPIVPNASNTNSGKYNLIFSMFGFQQMPDPTKVIENWIDALSNNSENDNSNRLILCFWPSSIEEDGALDSCPPSQQQTEEEENHQTIMIRPFTKWRGVVQQHIQAYENDNNDVTKTDKESINRSSGNSNNNGTGSTQQKNEDDDEDDTDDTNKDSLLSWDDKVVKKAKELGAIIVQDKYIAHNIKWESYNQFWDSMTKSGPWHAMRLKRGDKFVDELKDKYCKALNIDVQQQQRPLVHAAQARLLVMRKPSNIITINE